MIPKIFVRNSLENMKMSEIFRNLEKLCPKILGPKILEVNVC